MFYWSEEKQRINSYMDLLLTRIKNLECLAGKHVWIARTLDRKSSKVGVKCANCDVDACAWKAELEQNVIAPVGRKEEV